MFWQLENLERFLFNHDHLTSNRGIFHGEYLKRIHDSSNAKHITEYNLSVVKNFKNLPDISSCYRLLGDIYADIGEHDSAFDYYSQAHAIARTISKKDTLIETLLSRGRLSAKRSCAEAAFQDLKEALDYCTASGYRILEADIRVALAWAHFTFGDKEKAGTEAAYAKHMSEDMGYYWGKMDAEEVLTQIENAPSMIDSNESVK
jgi:tetratricopeptide (TPR) repeat protein